MTAGELKAFLEELKNEQGFSLAGWSPLEKPLSLDLYRQWLAENRHGEMKYLEEHLPVKENPQSRFPFARSALVFAVPYRPHPEPREWSRSPLRIASYAHGADYHFWFRDRLRALIPRLKEKFPEAEFEAHTDSSPLLERDLAVRAGLGWVGKNTCVIHPKAGSFFLLGEILTSLEFGDEAAPLLDFCGTCTRCLDVCPTQALVEPRKLDARRCLSYLSIESRQLPPEELRDKWGDWFFGCDLCQSVCPWNQKPFRPSARDQQILANIEWDEEVLLLEELRRILTSSGKGLERLFQGSPLLRAGPFGLKRNALMVAAHRGLDVLRPEIEALQDHERLGELARWALNKLGAAEATPPH
ncbi:MAG: tRNA epoxyqueuosine(34) reductase QueG [Bdellovibrionaceae bacterium]|nr:tRNA epoxyqueuosine(34) reductase QueG [Pseudobdellovibrionaceae bacterium]MBX3034726.1 tRNA epoxyqueuosine(34) reductase QueG [Pseudobdellovibrionaceae bacterium]